MASTCSKKNYQSTFYSTHTIEVYSRNLDWNKKFNALSVKPNIWQKFRDYQGIKTEEELAKEFIESYYHQVLENLDPIEISNKLSGKFLLDNEEVIGFPVRFIVAYWLQILLNEDVREVEVTDFAVKECEPGPKYIKEYLEEAMKANRNMRGFNSLRAVYLFEKGEECELEADVLEARTGLHHGELRYEATLYRCDADEAEAEYRQQKVKSMKKTTE